MPRSDPALTSLQRLLGLSKAPSPSILASRSADLAAALAEEAGASDDVSDRASALDYLELRLGMLAPHLPGEVAAAVRERFGRIVRDW